MDSKYINLTYLKVKIKSLAAESSIIRKEESKAKKQKEEILLGGLHMHRTGLVRQAARETLLAYAYLRGMEYTKIESKCKVPPNWIAVEKMIKKYSPYGTLDKAPLKDWYSVSKLAV